MNKKDWLNTVEFKQMVQETLKFSFKEAAEISLKEAKTGVENKRNEF